MERHVKAEVAHNNRFPGWRRMFRFWRAARDYYLDRGPSGLNRWGVPHTRAGAFKLLEPYGAKLVLCRSTREIARLDIGAAATP